MKVKELPLPEEFTTHLNSLGFVDLFPPQAAAVEAGLLEGKSLLVASPTASGKTLIGALAAYKRIVEEHRKVVYLSPLRALASEKYAEFRTLLERFGVRCVISTGDFDSAGEALKNYDLLVLTNEKFDSLLRQSILEHTSWCYSLPIGSSTGSSTGSSLSLANPQSNCFGSNSMGSTIRHSVGHSILALPSSPIRERSHLSVCFLRSAASLCSEPIPSPISKLCDSLSNTCCRSGSCAR